MMSNKLISQMKNLQIWRIITLEIPYLKIKMVCTDTYRLARKNKNRMIQLSCCIHLNNNKNNNNSSNSKGYGQMTLRIKSCQFGIMLSIRYPITRPRENGPIMIQFQKWFQGLMTIHLVNVRPLDLLNSTQNSFLQMIILPI